MEPSAHFVEVSLEAAPHDIALPQELRYQVLGGQIRPFPQGRLVQGTVPASQQLPRINDDKGA